MLAEKLILDLINKNNERTELLNERKELLEHNDKLLHEQENLLHEREQLLAMSARQLGKIQALENQLQAVEGDPRAINKQTPAFIQIPGMKENYKRHLDFNAVKEYSDMDPTEYNTTRRLSHMKRLSLLRRL